MVIGRQDEMQREKHGDKAQMQRPDTCRHGHEARAPKSPCGRKTRTSPTSSVARILASVGEKKTEIIPSDSPIRIAATTVPGRLPRPPMITTMKLSKRGSAPMR